MSLWLLFVLCFTGFATVESAARCVKVDHRLLCRGTAVPTHRDEAVTYLDMRATRYLKVNLTEVLSILPALKVIDIRDSFLSMNCSTLVVILPCRGDISTTNPSVNVTVIPADMEIDMDITDTSSTTSTPKLTMASRRIPKLGIVTKSTSTTVLLSTNPTTQDQSNDTTTESGLDWERVVMIVLSVLIIMTVIVLVVLKICHCLICICRCFLPSKQRELPAHTSTIPIENLSMESVELYTFTRPRGKTE